MKAEEYLRQELQLIAEKFPTVNIRYGYDTIINTHIVELLPLIEYDDNEELGQAWIPLSVKFMQEYMDEEIVFVSSDSELSLKNVIFEFNALACTEQNIITELFSKLTYTQLEYDFPTKMDDGILLKNSRINLINSPIQKAVISQDLYSYLNAA